MLIKKVSWQNVGVAWWAAEDPRLFITHKTTRPVQCHTQFPQQFEGIFWNHENFRGIIRNFFFFNFQ